MFCRLHCTIGAVFPCGEILYIYYFFIIFLFYFLFYFYFFEGGGTEEKMNIDPKVMT